MKRYSHAAAAVMSDDIVHIVNFGGYKGSTYIAATAVKEMSESLLAVLAGIIVTATAEVQCSLSYCIVCV